jgi:hypothetical protein
MGNGEVGYRIGPHVKAEVVMNRGLGELEWDWEEDVARLMPRVTDGGCCALDASDSMVDQREDQVGDEPVPAEEERVALAWE